MKKLVLGLLLSSIIGHTYSMCDEWYRDKRSRFDRIEDYGAAILLSGATGALEALDTDKKFQAACVGPWVYSLIPARTPRQYAISLGLNYLFYMLGYTITNRCVNHGRDRVSSARE